VTAIRLLPQLPLLLACALVWTFAVLLCSRSMVIGKRLRLLDVPQGRKLHTRPTPLMGGIVLIAVVLPISLVWTALYAPSSWRGTMYLWLVASGLMALLGLADDRHTLSATIRLVLSFLILGALAYFDPAYNIRFLVFETPSFAIGFGALIPAVLFTALCCVGLANAVNMADGKNGLVLGLSLAWVILLALRAPSPLWPICALLISALVVLLAFNLSGRIFLGDGGSYGFSTCIALLAILIYNRRGIHAGRLISAEELMLLFSVPVADSIRLAVSRISSGRSPMAAGRDHLHHYLQDRFGWPGGLLIYYMMALLPVCVLWTID
jgi:UDP-GlcNAc:undecaprenyl-phosphate GlcNAc-1-phosphate transferase